MADRDEGRCSDAVRAERLRMATAMISVYASLEVGSDGRKALDAVMKLLEDDHGE